MKGISFNLITDLLDNVFIFNEMNAVIFKGESLRTLFIKYNIDIADAKSYKLVDFVATLNKVREQSAPCKFKFSKIEEEFMLFPAKMEGKPRIILVKKDSIFRLSKIEYDLNLRVKEIECLYQISKELELATTRKEALTQCAKRIEEGFQFPQNTKVSIEVDNKLYGNSTINQSEVQDLLSAEIKIDDKKRGLIEVSFLHAGGYLEEEQMLVQEVAGKLARSIQESEKTINLEKQSVILQRKNVALIKLTEECHKRRENLRAFFSAITDKIVVIDKNYNIVLSNKEEIGDSGKCYEKLFNLKERCEECPAKQTFETGQDSTHEREVDEKYLTLHSYPIYNQQGKVDEVLELYRDITHQKKMEAQMLQSYKLASLGKLVAGVAHEINNPNTFILGNLKIVQEMVNDILPILDEHHKKNKDLKIARLDYDLFKENIPILVEDMINGAHRTKKIVADLRNFAKKDDGLLTEEVDINLVINNSLTLTRKLINNNVSLDLELAESVPVFCGRKNKLEQVLLDLILNASEAMVNGVGKIILKTGFDEKEHEVLVIIEDNGCGMDESVMRNIFDPFFTTKRDSGGTGLGLSITYGIMKDHNGKIDVDSKIGKGTTFTLRFPAKPND